jgi:hypothetical protein
MDGGQPSTQRGSHNYHGKVSYFSLDVYVDYLEGMAVDCKVPAVAFQFLDFPPITVYSPTSGEVRTRDEARRLEFSQGKSCVFEMVEGELHARMRHESVRVSWVDTWQLKERELGSVAVPLAAGMNRKIQSRAAHVQQGRYRLHDERGQPVCALGVRLSIVSHGHTLVPGLLRHRDYRAAPPKHGLRDDWEPVIKRLVREYYENKAPNHPGTGTQHQLATGDIVRSCERKIEQSEQTVLAQLDSISRRVAQVHRTNLELSGSVHKLQETTQAPRALDKIRVCELEERNARLNEQLVEMARLQRTTAKGLTATQILQAIKFQIAELLRRNPAFDLRRVFDAFDLDGDGVVSDDEFIVGLRELGVSLEPTQVPTLLENVRGSLWWQGTARAGRYHESNPAHTARARPTA